MEEKLVQIASLCLSFHTCRESSEVAVAVRCDICLVFNPEKTFVTVCRTQHVHRSRK